MRQAGILAAAGIVALETMVDRLAEDHANAKRLAKGLACVNGIILEEDDPPTNIVMFELSPKLSVHDFMESLDRDGVKVSWRGANLFRVVTHRMVSASDVDEAVSCVEAVCQRLNREG